MSTEVKPTKKPKAERGSGTTITIDFQEHPALLEKIRLAAKADDREPSKYLRRRLVLIDREGHLVPPIEAAPLFKEAK